MAKASETKEKGISRIDSGSTHGWFVRGYRNGKTFSRLFSDLKCGGRDKSLRAARDFRSMLYSQLENMPARPRSRRIVTKDARNKTGVLGVCKTTKKSPKGVSHECFSVSWRPSPGVQKCTSFSIRKYGEKEAFRLAVEHRTRMMQRISSSPPACHAQDGSISSRKPALRR